MRKSELIENVFHNRGHQVVNEIAKVVCPIMSFSFNKYAFRQKHFGFHRHNFTQTILLSFTSHFYFSVDGVTVVVFPLSPLPLIM